MPAGKSVYRGRGHRSKVRSGSALHGVALAKVEMPDRRNLNKVTRAEFPLQQEWGANIETFESLEPGPNKARKGGEHSTGRASHPGRRRAAASGL